MDEKSHRPSAKRLKRARLDGKVVRSQILTQLPGFVAFLLLMRFGLPWAMVRFRMLLDCVVENRAYDPANTLIISLYSLLSFVLTYLILNAGFSTLVDISQIGFAFAPASVCLRWDRLSITDGLKRSVQGLKSVWISLIKFIAIALLLLFLLNAYLRFFARFSAEFESAPLIALSRELTGAASFVALFLVLCGAGELLVRRRQHWRELSMSHEELRREHKEEEGDPMIRSQRKAMHESLLMQNLVRRIKRSKVIVVERM